jgi:hypothetical protein
MSPSAECKCLSADWQRALAVSYSKPGNVLTKQSKGEDAVKNYRLALAIMERRGGGLQRARHRGRRRNREFARKTDP